MAYRKRSKLYLLIHDSMPNKKEITNIPENYKLVDINLRRKGIHVLSIY